MSSNEEMAQLLREYYQLHPEKFLRIFKDENFDINKLEQYNLEDFDFYILEDPSGRTLTQRMIDLGAIYNENFFKDNIADSFPMAKWLVPRIVEELKCKSVLDVGCATGHWLKCFEEAGVKVKGLEGSKFAFDHMMIDPANVEHFDLRKKYQPTHSVDLVISIEVAEHIEQLFVGNYVDVLTKHGASNIIMTAAAPGQGGEGHVNEQPAEYWVEKLQDAGYKRNLQLEENIIHWVAEARAVKDAPLELRRLTTDKVPTVKEAPNWQTEFDALHSSTDKLVNAHWDNVWIPWWFPRNLICYRKE